jgi:hypothetical protein
MTIKASELKPGNVLIKAGRTAHSAITITAVKPHVVPGLVSIYGFNRLNPTPRLMFRHLAGSLTVEIL